MLQSTGQKLDRSKGKSKANLFVWTNDEVWHLRQKPKNKAHAQCNFDLQFHKNNQTKRNLNCFQQNLL